MKEILAKSLIFSIILFLLGNIIGYIVINNKNLLQYLIAPEVYEAILKSNSTTQRDKIILGDSVSHQIYNKSNDDGNYYILTTNQAVSVVGQYLLMRKVIEKNPNIKEVDLMMLPASFANNLDQPFTYNYFVKPFYTISNKEYLSSNVHDQLNKSKLLNLGLFPFIKIIKGFPNVDYSKFDSSKSLSMSTLSIEYLKKMQEECKAKNIKLRVIPSPISDINKSKSLDGMKKQIEDNNLSDIFSEYFKKVTFYDDKKSKDHVHFSKLSGQELKYYRDKLMK